jgi:predicted kinase
MRDKYSISEIVDVIQSAPATLFILCGYPYSGKSYVTHEIQERLNVECVSIDDIFYAHGFDWSTDVLPNASEWQDIFEESYAKVRDVLIQGKSVIFDSTNQTVASRDVLRDIARTMDVQARVLYITVPVETVWMRWEENQKSPVRSVVNRELVQMTIDAFEEPTHDENVMVIEN